MKMRNMFGRDRQGGPDARARRIGMLYVAGEREAAGLACHAALTEFPDHAVLWLLASECAQSMGNMPGAIDAAEQAIVCDGSSGDAWYRLGYLMKKERRNQIALRCMRKARICGCSRMALVSMGRLHLSLADFQNATACYRQALLLDPQDSDAWNELAIARLGNGQSGAAMAAARRAVRLRPDANAWETLGQANLAVGQYQAAVECFTRTIQLDWELSEAWYHLGLSYVRLEAFELARTALKQLRQQDLAWAAMLTDAIEGVALPHRCSSPRLPPPHAAGAERTSHSWRPSDHAGA